MKNSFYLRFLGVALAALCLQAVLQGCDKDKPAPATPPQVKLANSPAFGNYLTDREGMTLYFFIRDANNGTSACTGNCPTEWPPFYEKDLAVGTGLNADDFGGITRADGAMQNTYKGLPLYHFANDAAAGDTKGDGFGTRWFVAKPDYTVFLAEQGALRYLVEGNAPGKSLYQFAKDSTNVSNCLDACLVAWPEFFTDRVVVPSILKAADFGTIARSDGKQQITYQAKPLYFFAADLVRGDVKGMNIPNWMLTPAPAN